MICAKIESTAKVSSNVHLQINFKPGLESNSNFN